MKIFKDRKVEKDFVEKLEMLSEAEGTLFSALIQDLFWKKMCADEGEYSDFMVTSRDLDEVFNSLRFQTV